MSLGGTEPVPERTRMRALAHPTRLRILSLLTGSAMTAADLARELDLTHANASYHLRQLFAAGAIVVVGEERINGGTAKRYRYLLEADRPATPPMSRTERHAVHEAVAQELVRRSKRLRPTPGRSYVTDADLWVDPAVWAEVKAQISAASLTLHQAAQAPRTPDTIRVNATIALFELEPS